MIGRLSIMLSKQYMKYKIRNEITFYKYLRFKVIFQNFVRFKMVVVVFVAFN